MFSLHIDPMRHGRAEFLLHGHLRAGLQRSRPSRIFIFSPAIIRVIIIPRQKFHKPKIFWAGALLKESDAELSRHSGGGSPHPAR